MFCPKCGSKNEDSAAFCGSCGNKLNAPQVAEAAKGTPVVTTTATGSVTTDDGTTAVAAKKTGRTIGIIFAVVVVAAVAVTAIMTGGFGLMGSLVKSSVNEYSWDELSEISTEIAKASDESGAIEVAKKYNLCTQDGKLDGTQTKSITLSNGTDIDVQIVGFNHDNKTNGGKAGITFIFKDAISRHEMNSRDTNSGGWKDSEMRSWLAADCLNMLSDDLKKNIVEVEKLTNNVGETSNTSSVTSTSDKLWLFSTIELCGKVSWFSSWLSTNSYDEVLNSEGDEYKLYRDMNVISNGYNDILVKWFENSSCVWWERSPNPGFSLYFEAVGNDGNPCSAGGNASRSYGVVPGFCI